MYPAKICFDVRSTLQPEVVEEILEPVSLWFDEKSLELKFEAVFEAAFRLDNPPIRAMATDAKPKPISTRFAVVTKGFRDHSFTYLSAIGSSGFLSVKGALGS